MPDFVNCFIETLSEKIAVLEYKLGLALDIIKSCCKCDQCNMQGDCSTCVHDAPAHLRNLGDTDQWEWDCGWIRTLGDVQQDIMNNKEDD